MLSTTVAWPLAGRMMATVAIVSGVAFVMGVFFPLEMRLARPRLEASTPWFWGMNGAFGVLTYAITAALSVWSGIESNLWLAAAAYLGVLAPILRLQRLFEEATPAPSRVPTSFRA